MPQSILERYARSEDGKVIIDVNAEKVEYLYDDFDKYSPYHKKDLDQGLADYLVNSAIEIGKEDFIIKFRIEGGVDEGLKKRISSSVSGYFNYLSELEKRELAKVFKSSSVLLMAGLVILTLSVKFNMGLGDGEGVLRTVVGEGLTIVAWIAMWESIALLLLNWIPIKKNIKVYDDLSGADIVFA